MLRVLISETGEVTMVRVLQGLPEGLNEEAIKAAYQLKFKPAIKDGKPVPYWQRVNMSFNLVESPR